jgi:hypothetical protein
MSYYKQVAGNKFYCFFNKSGTIVVKPRLQTTYIFTHEKKRISDRG